MAKKVTGFLKLQVPAGAANPSPPIGPALGQRGLNIMEFCKSFNAQTQKLEKGTPIPVVITTYQDRSFTFEMKTPPVSYFLKKAASIESGAKAPGRDKAGSVTKGMALLDRAEAADPARVPLFGCHDNLIRDNTVLMMLVARGLLTDYRDDFGPFTPGFRGVPFGDLAALERAITPETVAVLVKQARIGTPVNTGAYGQRVAALRARMDDLQLRLADVSTQQNRFLQSLAIRELEGQKQRISTYQIQARYELAAIYDHAANDKPKANQ